AARTLVGTGRARVEHKKPSSLTRHLHVSRKKRRAENAEAQRVENQQGAARGCRTDLPSFLEPLRPLRPLLLCVRLPKRRAKHREHTRARQRRAHTVTVR